MLTTTVDNNLESLHLGCTTTDQRIVKISKMKPSAITLLLSLFVNGQAVKLGEIFEYATKTIG